AINNITQTMAVELGQYQIRVNAIAPAVVETPLTAPWLATESDRKARSAFYPLRRVGQPPDVAAAAVYFASDEAAWVSGSILLVSGGAVMTSDPYRYLMRVNRGKVRVAARSSGGQHADRGDADTIARGRAHADCRRRSTARQARDHPRN